jgi:ABC-type transport system involved in multi-copper enzyme maturation permease subunit
MSLATAVIILFTALVMTLLFSAFYGFGDMSAAEYLPIFAKTIGAQIYYHLSYTAIFTLFVFIARGPTMAMLIGFIYMVANSLAPNILTYAADGKYYYLMRYFPSHYIRYYAYGSAESFTDFTVGAISCAVIIIATTVIGIFTFSKADIK